mgnify:CR=1 FL=1
MNGLNRYLNYILIILYVNGVIKNKVGWSTPYGVDRVHTSLVWSSNVQLRKKILVWH